MRATLFVILAAALVAAVGAGPAPAALDGSAEACLPAPGKQPRKAPAPARLPSFSRVVVIVMENKDCTDVIGNTDAPYLNGLARRYAFASRWYAITDPSLPNYLALLGGSTFGIDSNCTRCTVDAPSLVDQLEQAGISWKAYMEGMPSRCFTGAGAGRYAKKHNPFVYFTRITRSPARCNKVVPLGELSTDLANGTLPRFVWITPDLCHDTHDCSIRTGDQFLAELVPPLLSALGENGLLVVTYDEDGDEGCCEKAAGGHVATVLAGPKIRRGFVGTRSYDHYSLLATIEEAWGLPRLADAGCPCTPLLGRRLFVR